MWNPATVTRHRVAFNGVVVKGGNGVVSHLIAFSVDDIEFDIDLWSL